MSKGKINVLRESKKLLKSYTPPKRKVPAALRNILEYDAFLTKRFVSWTNQLLPLCDLRIYYQALEVSCHGVSWIACWLSFIWFSNSYSLVQMQINMLLGLTIDTITVAVLKAYTRRRRPQDNIDKDDKLGKLIGDKFSFPSSHASRAVYITYFFVYLYPLGIVSYLPLLMWSVSVCFSRLLLNRHHILDIFAGVALGLFEGWLLGLLWLENDTTLWLWSYLTDEKLSGGEYHV